MFTVFTQDNGPWLWGAELLGNTAVAARQHQFPPITALSCLLSLTCILTDGFKMCFSTMNVAIGLEFVTGYRGR